MTKPEYKFVGKVRKIDGKVYFENITKSPLDLLQTDHISAGDEIFEFTRSGAPVYDVNPVCINCEQKLFRGDEVMICTHCCRHYDLELLPEDEPGRRSKNLCPDRE